jgi:hypothetical protein
MSEAVFALKCLRSYTQKCGRRGNLHFTQDDTYHVKASDVEELIRSKCFQPLLVAIEGSGIGIAEADSIFAEVHAPPPDPEPEEPTLIVTRDIAEISTVPIEEDA